MALILTIIPIKAAKVLQEVLYHSYLSQSLLITEDPHKRSNKNKWLCLA